MARLCPITGTKVVYLECQECDDKVCLKPSGKSTRIPEFNLEHSMPELTALQLTQNNFGWLHGEITGAHILHSQTGKWVPEFPDKPTPKQKAVLSEAVVIVNSLREKYDLKDLGLKMAREKFIKATLGMYKFAFYDDCFYVVIFDREAVESWYRMNISAILDETRALIDKKIITCPETEWEETGIEGRYQVSIHVGEMVYFGNIRLGNRSTLNSQIAKQLVCRCMDPYVAGFLRERGVYV